MLAKSVARFYGVCMYANNIFTICMYVCTVSTGIPREWPTGGRASPTT